MLSDLPVLVQNGKKNVLSQTLDEPSRRVRVGSRAGGAPAARIGLPGSEAMMVALPATAAIEDESLNARGQRG
jgi:hypothetical protein